MEQHYERRSAQRTVRITVTSGGSCDGTVADMVVRNPAPDASPPTGATGISHSFAISNATRY